MSNEIGSIAQHQEKVARYLSGKEQFCHIEGVLRTVSLDELVTVAAREYEASSDSKKLIDSLPKIVAVACVDQVRPKLLTELKTLLVDSRESALRDYEEKHAEFLRLNKVLKVLP
jgi:hypothetical protein